MVDMASVPSVSVVIPSLRGGAYLRESVASVCAQTLEDWELVIVLDGCEDDLSDLSDDRIRVLRQPRRGVSIARNVGLLSTSSELVAFLDDDDRMLPDRLLAQLRVMADERVVLCHTQFQYIDAQGVPTGRGGSRPSQYLDLLSRDGAIFFGTTMMRTRLIQEVGGFNSLLSLGEDLDLVYRVAREGEVAFLPEVLTEYRRHDSNTWLSTESARGEMRIVLTQNLWAAEDRGQVENVKAARKGLGTIVEGPASLAMSQSMEAWNNRRYAELVRSFARALRLAPLTSIRVATMALRRELQSKKRRRGS
jgi:glycosyltransferase involved in cell wall biosynthesis